MNVKLSSIQRDTSIQTRAEICMETVNSYAEAMTEGAKFPEVVLFGTADKCWIGDGWHRLMAAEQIDALDIPADLRKGGRVEALKYALGANAIHGQRRSNADKRRCVEIAVKEFAVLSSRAIAEMCGVSHPFVDSIRGPLETITNATRTTTDGRQYPATRRASKPTTPEEEDAMYFENEEKEKKQEAKQTGKQKGKYEDWQKLTALIDQVKEITNEISSLKVDAQHRIPARTLCESVSEKFQKLAQKLVE